MVDAHGFQVEQIDHVELFVPSRREAAAWYAAALGLVVLKPHESWADDPKGPLMISSDLGKTMVALFRGTPRGTGQATGFRRLAFRVGGAAFLRFVERLERGEFATATGISDHGAAYSAYFDDPWGNHLEVTTYDAAQVRDKLGQ